MTNQQGAPEAPSYEHQRAIMEGERNASLDAYSRVVYLTQTESRIYEAAFTNGWNRHAALVEAQQPATHVQNPAEIEHVAGDVSKNGAESNMAQQPAPSAAAAGLAFMLKTARLLAELHGETSLSEQQCAKHMGIDLVSWRRLEDCFSVGVFMPEGGGAELPREDSESVLREALGMRPSPTPQAASSAVLKAIRAANMQLVRTGDDEFMLVTFKQATPQADSQPAVDALAEAEYFIDNPSAWSNFDQRASDAIAAVCKALRAASAPADSQPAPQGEPWYGHHFKEVRRGYWQCSCGKVISEAASTASKSCYPPLPRRHTYGDDGEELFTADQMRAYADETYALRIGAKHA